MNTNTPANVDRVNTRVLTVMKACNHEGTNAVVNTISPNQVEFAGIRMSALDKAHYQARVAYIINSYWLSTKLDFVVMKVHVGKCSTFEAYKLTIISNCYRHETDLFRSESKGELLAKINGSYDTLIDLGL